MVQPHAERVHAKWSMSGASRWTVCLGQPNFTENIPEARRSKYAEAGDKAHEILEFCIEAAVDGVPAPAHKFTNSPDTIFAVEFVLDYIARVRAIAPDIEITNEHRVWFPQNVVKRTECGGTLDIKLYSPSLRRAWIIDFKFGEGVPVEVVGNKQLLGYATSALWDVPLADATLVVIQPRCFHPLGPVREWVVTAVELTDFAAEIDDVLRKAKQPDAPLVPGPHCRWCPAEHDCPVRETAALEGMQQNMAHLKDLDVWAPPHPKEVPFDKLVLIARHAPQIRAWLDAVEKFLLGAAIHGQQVPGFKIVNAIGRRKWREDEAQIAKELIALSDFQLGMDDVYPRRLATITDMEEKLVRLATADAPRGSKAQEAERIRHALAFLTDKQSSGNLTLVPDTDKRPATSALAQQFAHVAAALEPPEGVPSLKFGALPAPEVDPHSLIDPP